MSLMTQRAAEAENDLLAKVIEQLPDTSSQCDFIDAYLTQISALRQRIHAFRDGREAHRPATQTQRARARVEIIGSAAGWQMTFTPDSGRDTMPQVYSTERDPAGVLRDTGGSLLDQPCEAAHAEEVGMALSILAESLDDLSDALWRRAQGGE
jgi:hypothetical protein